MPSSPNHQELLDKIKELAADAESTACQVYAESVLQTEAASFGDQNHSGNESLATTENAEQKLDKQEAVKKVRALMTELNVNVVDILASLGRLDTPLPPYGPGVQAMGKPVSARAGRPRKPRNQGYQDDPSLPVRYRNKETGETWSGTGRVPQWIRDKELRGFSRDLFLVD